MNGLNNYIFVFIKALHPIERLLICFRDPILGPHVLLEEAAKFARKGIRAAGKVRIMNLTIFAPNYSSLMVGKPCI